MKTTHPVDRYEGLARFALGVVLLLIAWNDGWTVVGAGAAVLGVVSLATAFIRLPAIERPARHSAVITVAPGRLPSHLGHDVHDRAHEGHPWDTESL
ncbi:MAG TPA: hypothetical protein VG652_08320 [Gaiellaceae bacterium]|nr:hypothetical protein [Gaiellaceae bacterium]